MQRKLTMLPASVLLILLAGCQTMAGGGTDLVCSQWRAVSWSTKDTAMTVDGVKGNNARRAAWCST